MNRRGGVSRVGVRWWVAALTWAAACARELDPATCARRFDVQRDKIIRTEESQDMGARYLSELDVAARDQCLRLCCETDQCDVFVYEEKSPGNCYLFACGPPEDFRCKFTAHGNFSSGVLALSRRLAELQDVERLHLRDRDRDRDRDGDRDLIDLRKAASTSGPPAAPAPAQAHSAPPPTARPTTAKAGRRCSRYQFECRSGGECVAVYNACDGVPQCADGSDEAPELGCPASPAPAAPPTPQPRQPARTEYVPSKESGESSEGARWPHRLLQAQPARYADNGPSSHIFSHKGGLVQDTDGGVGVGASMGGGTGPFTPFEASAGAGAWPRRPWSHNAAQGLGLETGAGMGVRWGGGEFPRYEWAVGAALGAPDPRRGWPVPPAPQPPPRLPAPAAPETPVAQEVGVNGYATKTMPEMAAYPEQQHALHDGPKKGFDLMNGEPPAPPPAAGAPPVLAAAPPAAGVIPAAGAPPAPTARNDDNKSSPQTAQQKVARARARTSEVVGRGEPASGVGVGALLDDHDGLSESPPAAVLLLVLGVAMTSALGAVVACRWRGARRRGRRRGPFAHDADYLVNGMYL